MGFPLKWYEGEVVVAGVVGGEENVSGSELVEADPCGWKGDGGGFAELEDSADGGVVRVRRDVFGHGREVKRFRWGPPPLLVNRELLTGKITGK